MVHFHLHKLQCRQHNIIGCMWCTVQYSTALVLYFHYTCIQHTSCTCTSHSSHTANNGHPPPHNTWWGQDCTYLPTRACYHQTPFIHLHVPLQSMSLHNLLYITHTHECPLHTTLVEQAWKEVGVHQRCALAISQEYGHSTEHLSILNNFGGEG